MRMPTARNAGILDSSCTGGWTSFSSPTNAVSADTTLAKANNDSNALRLANLVRKCIPFFCIIQSRSENHGNSETRTYLDSILFRFIGLGLRSTLPNLTFVSIET